ncbi:MAG TPA: hypothetical protein VNT30_13855 [Stellaceae bacterium]|nr:hypothetical protein [Stellaceae bacterium]
MTDITNLDNEDYTAGGYAYGLSKWTIRGRIMFIVAAASCAWIVVLGLGYGIARFM